MGDKVSWASRSRLCCLGIPPAKWDPRSPYPTTFPSLSPRTNMFPLTLTLNPRVPNLMLHLSKCRLRGTKNKTYKTQFDPKKKKKKKKKKSKKPNLAQKKKKKKKRK